MTYYFQGLCKTLYCPIFSMPINGKCVPYMDLKVGYHLTIKLVPLEKVNASEFKKEEISVKIQIIKRMLGFQLCNQLSDDHYFINHTHEYHLRYIEIWLTLGIAKGCTTETIWSKITLIERRTTTIALMVDKRNILFNVSDVYEREHGSYCPKVPLTEMEYKTVLKKHPNVNELLFIPKKDGNKTIFICIDGYMTDERSAVRQSDVSLPLLAIICLFLFIK